MPKFQTYLPAELIEEFEAWCTENSLKKSAGLEKILKSFFGAPSVPPVTRETEGTYSKQEIDEKLARQYHQLQTNMNQDKDELYSEIDTLKSEMDTLKSKLDILLDTKKDTPSNDLKPEVDTPLTLETTGLDTDLDTDLDTPLDTGLDTNLDTHLDTDLDINLDTNLDTDLDTEPRGLETEEGEGEAGEPEAGAGEPEAAEEEATEPEEPEAKEDPKKKQTKGELVISVLSNAKLLGDETRDEIIEYLANITNSKPRYVDRDLDKNLAKYSKDIMGIHFNTLEQYMKERKI